MVARCFFTVSSLIPNSSAICRLRRPRETACGHLALALGQRLDVQRRHVAHGFLLRLGAQLPAYLPKRGRLENRTAPPDRRKRQDPSATASLVLLERVRAGDTAALNRLMDRYLPRLSRWASGRLPRWARDLSDTDDLVQDTLIRSVANLGHFEAQRGGRVAGLPARRGDEPHPRRDPPQAPHARARPARLRPLPPTGSRRSKPRSASEALAKYDRALERLDAETREAVIARIEMGCSYAEIAEAMGKPSPDAARMTVSRALVRLAEEMRHG